MKFGNSKVYFFEFFGIVPEKIRVFVADFYLMQICVNHRKTLTNINYNGDNQVDSPLCSDCPSLLPALNNFNLGACRKK